MNKTKIMADLPNMRLLFDEPLSNYTFTKTGGPADVLAFPKNTNEVKELVDYCNQEAIPFMVLGNASNLIVREKGIAGVVMMLEDMAEMVIEGTDLVVEAGAKLVETAKFAFEHTLTGLEFACGIPGSIGGAIYMNAGAYGGEVANVVKSVDVVWENGTFETLDNDTLKFSYRHSKLQEKSGVVISVRFALAKGEKEVIGARMAELTELRESKQPLEYPSCGSVFKRPEGHYTGQLIQEAGLQGLIWGGAQISTKHAGFIVNIDNATATDYVELIQHIQKTILKEFNVVLETEVRIIGRKEA
ncbi:UDP-N-acetylmuramate dehydrogenase [Vagococcus intermedius]|uniref:UDP-N-acetylenolpyruvoylglucosamine reductase n=1 Tax=Vagococcus intermedius TaxID=2991418 RepID=A0AAF0I7Z0_9ENTE|nr:UDP-N-acetylmuramate dehydrogenase [Vagococcus intermedius]WEG73411.1 UDP-N-acetylmuramate dehydrogenase [Vagococcus intermedius]WEG75494.1 UDP-N-acetylmuramate dehydrogenase [Vagococcus intermedius]